MACVAMQVIHMLHSITVQSMCQQPRSGCAQIVPTIYQDIRNRTILTNQYSVTEHFKQSDVPTGHQLPGVFFFYDLSPIKARPRPPCMSRLTYNTWCVCGRGRLAYCW